MSSISTDTAVRLVAKNGKFPHRFGGSPLHRFVGKATKSLNVHCLYLLSSSDPALPPLLPGVKWLPLYYPLFNNASDFAYQVLSDEVVRIHKVSGRPIADFPYKNFPQVLPERPVSVVPLSYDERKTLVYSFSTGPTGADVELSSADRKLIKRFLGVSES